MNIFNPVRYPGETMEHYRQRRQDCKRAVSIITKGFDPKAAKGKNLILADTTTSGHQRRKEIKAAGSIRQYKKLSRNHQGVNHE